MKLTIFEDHLCSSLSGFGPMASFKHRLSWYCQTFVCLILVANTCHGFYFLGPNMSKHTFSAGDVMVAKVNSLTSTHTPIPFSYYSLPYCSPMEGIKQSQVNIGQFLLGEEMLNSPYRFKMNVNQTLFVCLRGPLTPNEVKLLIQRTREMYEVNMMLDYLPVIRYMKFRRYNFQWNGFPVGDTTPFSHKDYIFNHLKFRVLIHEHKGNGASGFEIVGFEVVPCSVKHARDDLSKLRMHETIQPISCHHNLEKSQLIQENETVAFTYEAEFVKSDIRWSSRWDRYDFGFLNSEAHWFAILFSVATILILAGIALAIYLRAVRRELTQYEELDKKAQAPPGWKLIVGDVFREPKCAKLLCLMVGQGVQIICTSLATTVFAFLGFVSSSYGGMLLTSFIMLYLICGIAAGYAAVRLWRTIKGTSEGWISVSWCVACFFPGIVFAVMAMSNVLLSGTRSTRIIPLALFLILVSLWFCISVPLTLLGGFLGTKAVLIEYPVGTNKVPREIHAHKYRSWLVVLGAGILPFGTFLNDLYLILQSMSFGRFYIQYGFLLVALLSLIAVCAIVSVILSYTRLRVGDWCWWWKAFFASGSAGIYAFIYSIFFLYVKLNGLSGPVPAVIYMGYSLIMAIAVLLATGTIGFLVSIYSVHRLYLSAKVDC